jgi:hypothetical protein
VYAGFDDLDVGDDSDASDHTAGNNKEEDAEESAETEVKPAYKLQNNARTATRNNTESATNTPRLLAQHQRAANIPRPLEQQQTAALLTLPPPPWPPALLPPHALQPVRGQHVPGGMAGCHGPLAEDEVLLADNEGSAPAAAPVEEDIYGTIRPFRGGGNKQFVINHFASDCVVEAVSR